MEQIIRLTSVNNEKVKYFISLLDKKNRNKEQLFLIEGYHLVEEASKTPYLKAVIATNEEDLKKYPHITKYVVTQPIIEKISTTKNPQSMLGVVTLLNNHPSQLSSIINKEKVKLVMLDEVNDPGNLGTIIRTTAALGYDALIMSENTVDLYNEKVIRSTQGVLFKIPIIKGNLKEMITYLKKQNIKCFGTSLKNAKSLQEADVPSKFLVCFGNEARGLSNDVLHLMDENIKIVMKNNVESLNVSVASGIVMYELGK